ncbi:MAG: hypothetical protein ACRDZO_02440 [Egibacteraceae bacterium]
MAREKTTIMVERSQVSLARELTGAVSTSEVVSLALGRLIRTEQLRKDIEAYTAVPPDDADLALAELPVVFDLDDDDVDYEALYGGEA